MDSHEWTDAQLEKLERRMAREYGKAAKEMKAKYEKWTKDFEHERAMRLAALDDTAEAKEAYERWLKSQAARGKWIADMTDVLAKDAVNANQKALAMANDALPAIYAENANRAAFDIDMAVHADTEFTLLNEDAVRNLMAQKPPQLTPAMPNYEARVPRDMRWNRQKFTSAITQGILQGEGMRAIEKRLESVVGSDYAYTRTVARTAVTCAENMGHLHSYERAQSLGIDVENEWLATIDERTRESHREMDGMRVPLGEKFPNGCEFPGDPAGEPEEVYNCRCRLDGRVVGFDGIRGAWAEDVYGERWARLPDGMTYEQWKAAKPTSREESYKNPVSRMAVPRR